MSATCSSPPCVCHALTLLGVCSGICLYLFWSGLLDYFIRYETREERTGTKSNAAEHTIAKLYANKRDLLKTYSCMSSGTCGVHELTHLELVRYFAILTLNAVRHEISGSQVIRNDWIMRHDFDGVAVQNERHAIVKESLVDVLSRTHHA